MVRSNFPAAWKVAIEIKTKGNQSDKFMLRNRNDLEKRNHDIFD
jgi:hypothetical protein